MTDFERGDVYAEPDGSLPIQIQSVGRFGEYVTVTDPTDNHPQSSRSGTWDAEVSLLEEYIESGELVEAELSVVTDD